MPINSLEQFLFERGLVGTHPIESLKNTTLGIDVNHYVSRLLSSKKEQFLDAIGGFPISLKLYLESDLEIFKEYNITPVFIFNGSLTVNQLDYNSYFTAGADEASLSLTLGANSISSIGTTSINNNNINMNMNINNNINNNNNNNHHNNNDDNISSTSINSPNQNLRSTKEIMLTQRHKAWTQWNNLITSNQHSYIDQPLKPQEPFRLNTNIESKRFQSDLIKYFIENDIIYQVAPFSSWIQLDYLLQNNFIDAIYGPTDCLMLPNLDKFILGMEFPNKDFRFIDKNRLLKDFGISYDEFIDISMTVGNDLQPTVLPPLQIYPNNKLFEIALEMALNTGTNFYAYQLNNRSINDNINANNTSNTTTSTTTTSTTTTNNSNNYILFYQRGCASLRHMPVLQSDGRVEIYSTGNNNNNNNNNSGNNSNSTDHNNSENKDSSSMEDVDTDNDSNVDKGDKSKSPSSSLLDTTSSYPTPNDVHEFIGQRLPAEYYYYKSIGLISGKLLDSITTGIYPEEPPLDGGISDSYRKLVVESIDMFKNKEINLLTQQINRYFQMKPIKQVKWYSPNNKVQLTNRVTPSIIEQLKYLVIKTDYGNNPFNIYEFIKILYGNINDLSKKFIAEKPIIIPRGTPENQLSSTFDLLSTCFLRLLVQLEFFEFDLTKKSLKPTSWGNIILHFSTVLNDNEEYYEKLFILLLFLKTGVLSLSEETRPNVRSSLSDHTLRTYPQESKYILILSRLLTLFQIDQKPTTVYHGPIDKKTLIFREHIDFIRENLNDMFEALVVASLTSNEFDRLSLTNFQWQSSLVQYMPFKCSLPNTVMAVMMEFFLQKYLHNGNNKSDAMSLVATEFSTYKSVPNLSEQFEESMKYLKICDSLIKELVKAKLIKQDESELCFKAIKFASDCITES